MLGLYISLGAWVYYLCDRVLNATPKLFVIFRQTFIQLTKTASDVQKNPTCSGSEEMKEMQEQNLWD